MWEINVDLVEEWLFQLDDSTYVQVMQSLGVLERVGPALGRPLVDRVVSSRHQSMKELRPGSGGRSKVRILFVFDPTRQAILLVAGDKSSDWDGWYRKMIPVADALYDDHLRNLKGPG